MPEQMNVATQNTDRKLWQSEDGTLAVSLTEGGGIAINVGGHVIVKTADAWQAAASDLESLRARTAGKGAPPITAEQAIDYAFTHLTVALPELRDFLETWWNRDWSQLRDNWPEALSAIPQPEGVAEAWLVIGAEARRPFLTKEEADTYAKGWGVVKPLFLGVIPQPEPEASGEPDWSGMTTRPIGMDLHASPASVGQPGERTTQYKCPKCGTKTVPHIVSGQGRRATCHECGHIGGAHFFEVTAPPSMVKAEDRVRRVKVAAIHPCEKCGVEVEVNINPRAAQPAIDELDTRPNLLCAGCSDPRLASGGG